MSTRVVTDPAVQLLEDRHAIGAAITRLLGLTKYETLSALPDDVHYDLHTMRSSWDDDVALLDRGIDCRIIYPARAAHTPEMMEYLTQYAARGAKVRVLGSVPNRILLSDRVRAIVPEVPESESAEPSSRALLINGKVLVRALYNQFLDLWRSSLPVGFSTGGLDVELVRDTLAALSGGMTDEAAARKNGWSLRTYRRRIAAVMDLLGSNSRFEAGALAREQGWI